MRNSTPNLTICAPIPNSFTGRVVIATPDGMHETVITLRNGGYVTFVASDGEYIEARSA